MPEVLNSHNNNFYSKCTQGAQSPASDLPVTCGVSPYSGYVQAAAYPYAGAYDVYAGAYAGAYPYGAYGDYGHGAYPYGGAYDVAYAAYGRGLRYGKK